MTRGQGGKRQGKPGKAYANRTDLNARKPLAPTAVPNQQYGQAAAQLNAQKVVPMGPPPAAAAPAQPAMAPPAPMPEPGSFGAFNRPTERPEEPVMAGAPMGEGPGPEVLGMGNPDMDEIRALYLRFPSEDLRELIEDFDEGLF